MALNVSRHSRPCYNAGYVSEGDVELRVLVLTTSNRAPDLSMRVVLRRAIAFRGDQQRAVREDASLHDEQLSRYTEDGVIAYEDVFQGRASARVVTESATINRTRERKC